jgi:hypothetical protein
MQTVSQGFIDAITNQETPRELYAKIEFKNVDLGAKAACTPTANTTDPITNADYIIDEIYNKTNYATLENDRITLAGNFTLVPDNSYENAGWWSETLSLIDNTYTINPIITLTMTSPRSIIGFVINWDAVNNECAESFIIRAFDNSNVLINTITETTNTNSTYITETPINNYKKIEIEIVKWSKPYRRARISEVDFGILYIYSKENGELIELSIEEEIDILAVKDSPNTIKFSIDNVDKKYDILNPDGAFLSLQKNQEIEAWIGAGVGSGIEYVKMGKFYLQEWETNQNSLEAKFTGMDILEVLNNRTYYKGLQSSITLYNLAVSVLEDAGLNAENYILDNILTTITVSNALKVDSYKKALQTIAIAANCVYYVNRDNKIVIEPLKTVSTGFTVDKDNMLEPTPKITLENVIKTIEVANYNITEDVATTELAKINISKVGTDTIVINYSSPASAALASIVDGVINSATYYTYAAVLNVTSTATTVITIEGNKITYNNSIFSKSNAETTGNTLKVDNILVSDTTLAESIADHILDIITLRTNTNVKWRTHPALEIGDIVDVETNFNTFTDTYITKQTWEYNGALKGNIGTRG